MYTILKSKTAQCSTKFFMIFMGYTYSQFYCNDTVMVLLYAFAHSAGEQE